MTTNPQVLMHDPSRPRHIAHVGPVELYTPALDQSVDFFTRLMSLREVHRDHNSVYLHTWDDYQSWTLRLIQSDHAGVARTYLRAASPAALQALQADLSASGAVLNSDVNTFGLGEILQFRDPDGHPFGIYWEVDHYTPDGDQPALKNQAAALPNHGVRVRRLDHINYLTSDVPKTSDFLATALGARCTERIIKDDGTPAAIWYSVCNKSYDLVYTEDWTGSSGRLHHIAFATDTREDILRAADLFLEAGVHIETGPHKHAIQQTFFLYIWEPGGNRIELCNAGARLLLAPDHRTVTWTLAERAKGQAWGLKTIETFHTYGTPAI